jgi:YfiH family protein
VQRIDRSGIVFYRFARLAQESDLDHALFTRLGGVSRRPFASLNMGHTVGDDGEAVATNHRRALAALGWGVQEVATCHLVHGARVGIATADDRGQVRPATDALVTAEPGVLLFLRFADCVPVLFYAHKQRVVGIAHAGWRGIPAGVIPATVQTMRKVYGCQPADIWAGIGPSIGPCCYQVGTDVVEQIVPAVNGGYPFRAVNGAIHLDLWAAIEHQLEAAGVGDIDTAHICTACRRDEWFSHRAEKGKTGRFGVALGLRA